MKQDVLFRIHLFRNEPCKNHKRPHEPARRFLIQYFRHSIETCFSQLAARFSKKIHATSAAGFALKIGLFVFVQALDRFGL